MPSSALTVTLNFDQCKKFVLVLTQSTRSGGRDAILREARNKFRVKGLSCVFLRGGTVLNGDGTVPESVSQVWVGKGEPYSGPPNIEHSRGRIAETRIISGKSFIDDSAIKQLEIVGALPGVRLAVGMPDLHPGNRFPIGCAIAAEGIYPALIGSDVGCGIALYRLSASSARSLSSPKKLAGLLRGLDDPWSGSVSEWLARYDIDRASPFDLTSLGTVGAGNHFAEICTPENIIDTAAAASLKIQKGYLYLLIHTGSRGLGASILAGETASESNPYIDPDSPHLAEYLREHDYAVKWAVANRDLVAYRIKQCLYSSSPEDANSTELEGLEKLLDVTHNSVTKHNLHITSQDRSLWVHRKGAAPADQGAAPCPGSRGDYTWILQPIGNGQFNAQSLAHGAGRRYGRNVLHTGTKIAKSSLTTTALGSEVICTDTRLLIEEQPGAYKDVQCVVEDMQDHGICRGIVQFRPVVTYKVRGDSHSNEKD